MSADLETDLDLEPSTPQLTIEEVAGTLIRGMSNKDYHSFKNSNSSSQLKTALEDMELFHDKYVAKTIAKEESNAFDLGTCFHTSILEPHLAEAEMVIFKTGIKRGAAWEEFKARHAGKIILSQADKAILDSLVKAVHNSPHSMALIKDCEVEISAFCKLLVTDSQIYADVPTKGFCKLTLNGWEPCDSNHAMTGVILYVKARADALGEDYILDLKSTTGNVKKVAYIKEQIKKYSYQLSAAFYLDVFSAVTGKDYRKWYWTFGSKEHGIARTWKASEKNIRVGRAMWRDAILAIAKHQSQGWQFEEEVLEVDSEYWQNSWLEERAEDIL